MPRLRIPVTIGAIALLAAGSLVPVISATAADPTSTPTETSTPTPTLTDTPSPTPTPTETASPTTITTSVSANPVAENSVVTVTVALASAGDTTGGTVELLADGASQGTAPVVANAASFAFRTQNAGVHTLTASFGGTATASAVTADTQYTSIAATRVTVVGHIRDAASGKGIKGARVSVTPTVAGHGVASSVLTSATGRFELSVVPGQYTLRAVRAAKYYVPSSAFVHDFAAGSRVRINKRMSIGGQISGRVYDPSGGKLANVAVALQRPGTDDTVVASAVTDSTGAYYLRGLTPATYTIRYTDLSGTYKTEYFDSADSKATAAAVSVAYRQKVTGRSAVLAAK
ncbi:carboxypeptidase regulatory-like domain-containing protein [Galbitalea sp. SE-J8]|uniref:carboxypeptidase regulatory-like domain-containing protein n=1 Tax=Galbitalea sp. SE-J8 TaxID=3054952 RepID=UPI00259D0DC8|nr:carboxypeptidase regulatory-like domain-containing protein [Galbitalea sp. SE-J8]MDM4763840.1 carboxypeptidase regulatory-like domain-containing protein [Galbitalea sp. SE-J8]